MKRKVKKVPVLTKVLRLRISEAFYIKMLGWLADSNCQTIGELARAILYREEIIWYHKDASIEELTKELVAIRRELKAIGTNVNQITRYFNSTHLPNQKIYYALKVQEEYNKVGNIVQQLLIKVSEVIKRWSQG